MMKKNRTGSRHVYVAFSLMVLAVLSGCASMVTAMVQKQLVEAQQKELRSQIKRYDKLVVDKTIAAHIVGTWRNVSVSGVTVWSFSDDGNMRAAVRMFAGGNPDNFLSMNYKVSKDTFAQRAHDEAFAQANPKLIADSAAFYNYAFSDDYSELRLDLLNAGMEFASIFTRIDDAYMDSIPADILDAPRSTAQTAGLVFDHVWRQPNEIVRENQYADWTATFRVNAIKINGKAFGLLPSINLPEGEYEIVFDGTITFRRAAYNRELSMYKRFRTTLKKGHIYEVKAYVDPEDMYLTLTLGPDQHSTLKTAVTLTEISWEQFEREYW
jgi:hypothetical protein